MGRDRAIDLTALAEEASAVQRGIPAPRFPSWEELGLQGTPTADAASAALLAPAPRRRDLRASAQPATTAATTRWPSTPEHDGYEWYDEHDGRSCAGYDEYEADGHETGVPAHPTGRPTGRSASHQVPLHAELERAGHLDLADVDHDAAHLLDLDDEPARQRPAVMTWLLVAVALVLTGLVGYLLGAGGHSAELAAARTAAATAQQAQQTAEQQLSAAQQAQANAESAAAAAQDASAAVPELPTDQVTPSARASARASAAPSASAEPATADAAGATTAGAGSDGSDDSGSGGAAKAPSKAPSSAPASGAGSDAGSGASDTGDSGSIGSDPAAPAADPAG